VSHSLNISISSCVRENPQVSAMYNQIRAAFPLIWGFGSVTQLAFNDAIGVVGSVPVHLPD